MELTPALSPAQTLPYELLGTVFKYCVTCTDSPDFFPTSFATILLSQVCSTWRSVAQTSPRLWSIDLRYPDLSHRFFSYIKGNTSSLYVTCSYGSTLPKQWPNWLLSHLQGDDVEELSVRVNMTVLGQFLKGITEDLPCLKRLHMYTQFDFSSRYGIDLDIPAPFLRSWTISHSRPRSDYYFPTRLDYVPFLTVLKNAPNLSVLRLDNVSVPDKLHLHGLDKVIPVSLPQLRECSLIGINRLKPILELVSLPPSSVKIEIDGIGKLDVSADLAAVTKQQLRTAGHTHLSITTTAIQTSTSTTSGGRYLFSGIHKQGKIQCALMSYGRAFFWANSITHLSINPDGRMFCPTASDSESWDEALAPAWSKLFNGLPLLTNLTITGFQADNVFNALRPFEAKARKTMASCTRVRCPRLDTIVLLDFAAVPAVPSEEEIHRDLRAPLVQNTLVEILEERRAAGKQLNRLIFCNCIVTDSLVDSLERAVADVSLRG